MWILSLLIVQEDVCEIDIINIIFSQQLVNH